MLIIFSYSLLFYKVSCRGIFFSILYFYLLILASIGDLFSLMMLEIKPRMTLHMLSMHPTTPNSLVSFDQNSMLVVDFASFILSCRTPHLVSQQICCLFFVFYVGSCDEIDMILNNPKVTTLLDNHYDNERGYIKFIQKMLFKSS